MNKYHIERHIEDYADIIDLPPHEPYTRPRMSMMDRAAQFAPYAALVGYGDMVVETARITDRQLILGASEVETLNAKLQILQESLDLKMQPAAEISYFLPDTRKAGGCYHLKSGHVKRIDIVNGKIHFTDKTEIRIDRINDISSDLFSTCDF